MPGSFSNVPGGQIQSNTFNQPQQNNDKGNIIGNAKENIEAIGAGITTLVGGILGYDKEGRQAIENIIGAVQGDSEKQKGLADALLSTYNLTLDDLGNMPLGEVVGNVATGIWQHPIDAYMDFMSLKGLLIPRKVKAPIDTKDLKLGDKIDSQDFLVREAEQATKNNVNLANVGNDFIRQVENIETKYTPNQISLGMQAIETLGFKQAPRELREVMQDLTKANDTYKQFTSMAGANMFDDVEFATRELLAKENQISFESTEKLKGTKLYQDAEDYVRANDIKPLFHLKPKVYDLGDVASDAKVETDLLKRGYGTIDYNDAPKNLGKKASEFVHKVVNSEVTDTPNKINERIREVNKLTGSNIKQLDSQGLFGNRAWRELNSELKKVMLSSGVYLGANIITTTLSILNNFNLNAVAKTLKNLPKFKLTEVAEAKTPWLNKISKLNNKIYRPIASVDKYLESIATEYIKNIGLDKAKYMQSAIPSKAVITNPALRFIKEAVPFGQYPAAAMQELQANLTGRPIKSALYNQINKLGQEANVQAQELLGLEPDRTKAIRLDEEGNQIQRSTVITPIQAANMFVFGTYGDALQIPVINFVNKLLSGVGDPNVFEVDGKSYRMKNGVITTSKGEFNLLPAIVYASRSLLSPVQLYNQVIVPILSDKYVKDETKLFNQLVSDSQYANMNSAAQRKVTDKAKEKLGKRLLGTYEYKVYNQSGRVSKSTRRKILRQQLQRRSLNEALR